MPVPNAETIEDIEAASAITRSHFRATTGEIATEYSPSAIVARTTGRIGANARELASTSVACVREHVAIVATGVATTAMVLAIGRRFIPAATAGGAVAKIPEREIDTARMTAASSPASRGGELGKLLKSAALASAGLLLGSAMSAAAPKTSANWLNWTNFDMDKFRAQARNALQGKAVDAVKFGAELSGITRYIAGGLTIMALIAESWPAKRTPGAPV